MVERTGRCEPDRDISADAARELDARGKPDRTLETVTDDRRDAMAVGERRERHAAREPAEQGRLSDERRELWRGHRALQLRGRELDQALVERDPARQPLGQQLVRVDDRLLDEVA